MVQYPIAHSSFHIYFKHFNQNKRLIDSYNLVRYYFFYVELLSGITSTFNSSLCCFS